MRILSYHKVNCIDSDPLTVRTEMFLRQLDYLEDKGFNFISPEGLQLDNRKNVLLTFDDGYKDNYEVVYPILKAKGIPALIFVAFDFLGKEKMLGLEELKTLSRNGVTIGSHTISHPRLTSINKSEAEKEIAGSKDKLEKLLNQKVEYFSYPYGDVNEDIIELVRDSGYKAAFVTPSRRHIKSSHFTLKRIGIYYHNNLPVFKFKLLF
jgi:peptidoglycan/xylan/chitin deacetylase (PgdA/CDA1 family)